METYTPINWEDSPSTATPLTAENLNHMDEGIVNATNSLVQSNTKLTAIENDVENLQTEKVDKTAIISAFDKLLTDTEKIPTADAIINFLADYYYDINDTYSSDEIDEMINNISVGSAGKSAYQIAVDNGFVGTESEWLATLKGSDGADGTDGAPGADGIGISKIDFNSSTVDGGNNVITITKTDGKSSTFTVKNGTAGTNGNDGVSITAVSQTNTSNADNGNNVITVYLSNGNASTFTVKNGSKGDKGDTGAPGADYVLTSADKQEIANLVNTNTDIIPGYVRTAAGNIAEKMIGVTGEFISSSQPAYTNQLFTSTDSDGTTIYNNGTGYKTGYRLNSSNAESAQTGFCVTGYIPCAPGDIVRLKNISFNANGASIGSVKIVAYKSDKTVLSSCAVGNMTAVSGIFDDTGNLTQFTTVANCHYFRLSCYDINANSIITVNEEITTTESTGQDGVPFNFAFLSDIHYSANYKNGIKHTEQALNVISERAHIDLVAFGGDYIPNWTRMSKTNAVAAITDTKINYADIKTPCLWLKGNHDNNGYTGERLSKAEIYNRIMCKNRDVHGFIENPNDPYGGYGYVDFDNSKIRVIVVNTSDNDNMSAKPNESGAIAPVINAHNVSAVQIQWLADNALDFSSKENAGEWGIIVISHVPIFASSSIGYWTSYTDGDNKSWTLNRQNVADLIKAYIDKTSFTATLNGETATKDFSNLTETAEVICFVNGHGHSERVGTYNGFKFIWCPATAAVASKSDDGNTYTKTADTVNDTAFTMFTVDRANHKIHAWNYGAGYDREIGY